MKKSCNSKKLIQIENFLTDNNLIAQLFMVIQRQCFLLDGFINSSNTSNRLQEIQNLEVIQLENTKTQLR